MAANRRRYSLNLGSLFSIKNACFSLRSPLKNSGHRAA